MKFILRNEKVRENLIDHIDLIEIDEDKPIEVILKEHKKTRLQQQNALYWIWLREISDHSGNDTDELHAYYRDKFIGYKTLNFQDKKIEELISTTTLNVKEFSKYMEKIEIHALDFFGVQLPDADMI